MAQLPVLDVVWPALSHGLRERSVVPGLWRGHVPCAQRHTAATVIQDENPFITVTTRRRPSLEALGHLVRLRRFVVYG